MAQNDDADDMEWSLFVASFSITVCWQECSRSRALWDLAVAEVADAAISGLALQAGLLPWSEFCTANTSGDRRDRKDSEEDISLINIFSLTCIFGLRRWNENITALSFLELHWIYTFIADHWLRGVNCEEWEVREVWSVKWVPVGKSDYQESGPVMSRLLNSEKENHKSRIPTRLALQYWREKESTSHLTRCTCWVKVRKRSEKIPLKSVSSEQQHDDCVIREYTLRAEWVLGIHKLHSTHTHNTLIHWQVQLAALMLWCCVRFARDVIGKSPPPQWREKKTLTIHVLHKSVQPHSLLFTCYTNYWVILNKGSPKYYVTHFLIFLIIWRLWEIQRFAWMDEGIDWRKKTAPHLHSADWRWLTNWKVSDTIVKILFPHSGTNFTLNCIASIQTFVPQ